MTPLNGLQFYTDLLLDASIVGGGPAEEKIKRQKAKGKRQK